MKTYPNFLDCEYACRYLLGCPNGIHGRRSRWHAVASPHCALSCRPRNTTPCNTGNVRPRLPRGSRGGGESSSCWPRDTPNPTWPRWSGSNGRSSASGPSAFWRNASRGLPMPLAGEPRAFFPPEVAIHVVRLACERPDTLGSQPLAMGLPRTGAPAHRGGGRGGHLRRDGAADFALP